MMSNELNSIIERDKKVNPDCSYSFSSSRTCNRMKRNDQNNNDTDNIEEEMVCKIIQKIQRHCPNMKSKVIYSHSTTDSNNELDEMDIFSQHSHSLRRGFESLFPRIGELFGDLFDSDGFSNSNDYNSKSTILPSKPKDSYTFQKPLPKNDRKNMIPFQGEIVGPSETI